MSVPAFLHPFAPPAREDFVAIVRGDGAAVFDDQGRRYVDALASLWYCQVGHGRAEIADAVHRQMGELATYNTFDRFTNGPVDQLAERLRLLAPMPDARVFLTTSGSEAVDSALKLARLAHHRSGHPERTVVIARSSAYHGVTYGGLSVQGLPLNKTGWGPLLDDVTHVPHDDCDALEAAVEQAGDRLAAIIAEPVIGAGGVIPPVPGYLEALRRACDRTGAFLILDEVINGFGRLGAPWGAVHYGVTPDLAVFAKGVTSGYLPLGGVLVGPAVRAPLEADPDFLLRHGHTYSGHPSCCAAALANLDIIERESLADRAAPVGARLRDGLTPLVDAGRLAAVRGEGALLGTVMPPGVSAMALRLRLADRGVIARAIGEEVVALCPPLVIGDDDLDLITAAFAEALADPPLVAG